jgi:hypothetical protein
MNQVPVNKILIKKKDGKIKPLNFDLDEQQQNTPIVDDHKKDENDFKEGISPKLKNTDQMTDKIVEKEKKAPNFYFHIEDEEEASKFFDKKKMDLGDKKKQLIDIYIKEILLFFDNLLAGLSEGQNKKIKKVLETYLRGVRSFLDFKLILTEEGPIGFNLDEESAYKILKKAENKRNDLDGLDNAGLMTKMDGIEKEKKVEKTTEPERQIKKGKIENLIEKVKKTGPVVEEKKEEVKQVVFEKKHDNHVQKEAINTQDIKKPFEPEPSYIIKRGGNDELSKKHSIKKVVSEKMTKGSLEEIEEIDLVEFRKGGDNSKARVNKIYEKIKLLENQSTTKRVAGVTAWKRSPVYKEYVSIGEMSLLENKKIEEVIGDKNSLTLDEFNSIADLNNELNY